MNQPDATVAEESPLAAAAERDLAAVATRASDLRSAGIALSVGATMLLAMLLGGVLLTGRYSDHGAFLPAAALAVIAGGAVAVARPRWVFLGFLLGCMAIYEVFETVYLPAGFMKVYIQDLVFAFNAGLIVCRTAISRTVFRAIPFNRYVALHFMLGVWGVFNGLALRHNAFDEAFGDFRRSFFYFMNYFVALWLVDDLRDMRMLRRVLTAGGVLIIAKGVLQTVFGQFYSKRYGDAAHILSHFELTFLSFCVYYSAAQLLMKRRSHRLWWMGLLAMGIVTTIVGNYRASWLGLAGGFAVMFFYVSRRQKWMLAGVAALAIILAAAAFLVLKDVPVSERRTTLGEEIKAKASIGKTREDTNVKWRFESYAAALENWKKAPVLGTGLGTRMEFVGTTSTGAGMIIEGHRVHNSLLWLLMVQGIVGCCLILLVQFKYILTLARYLHRSRSPEGSTTVLACGAFYVSFMISTFFEVLLESAMPITVLSSSMALSMLAIHFLPAGSGAADGRQVIPPTDRRSPTEAP